MTTAAVATWAQVIPTVMIALVVDLSFVRNGRGIRMAILVTILALALLEILMMCYVTTDAQPSGWVGLVAVVVLGGGMGFLCAPALLRMLRGKDGSENA